MIPAPIEKALRHVQSHYPAVTSVTFDQEDKDCGGFWAYRDANGNSPHFDHRIDVGILEDAIDAAYEDKGFPTTYELT